MNSTASTGMYATKRFHQKGGIPFLSVGDPYVDRRDTVDDRYKNRQFQTSATKTGQTAGYFGKFEHQPDSYQQYIPYRELQPRDDRQTGFGSSDAHKRDEFSHTIKCAQYKELLSHEKKYEAKLLAQANEKLETSRSQTASQLLSSTRRVENIDPALHFQTQVPTNLYDIGRSAVTPTCYKCTKETFYCPHRLALTAEKTGRLQGAYTTENSNVGKAAAAQEAVLPQYGGFARSHIKQFWDSTHLSVGSD